MGFDTAIKLDAGSLFAGEVIKGHVSNTEAFITFENGFSYNFY